MTRRRALLVFLPALVIVAVAGLFRWLLYSESGANWIWRQAAGAVPGELRVERLEGSLKSRLELSGLSWRDDAVEVALDRASLRLDLDLLPLAVSVEWLRAGDLAVTLGPDDTGPADTDVAAVLAALALPFPLEFKSIELQSLRLRRQDAAPERVLQRVTGKGSWFRSITLRNLQLTLEQPAVQLEARLRLGLQKPFELELDARAVTAAGAFDIDTPLQLQGRLAGDLDRLQLEAGLDRFGARLSGTLGDMLGEPSWDLQLSSPEFAWPPSDNPDLVLSNGLLGTRGSLSGYELELTGALQLPDWPVLDIRLAGAGDQDAAEFRQVTAAGGPLAFSGRGQLAWTAGLAVAASLDLERFDPSAWLEAWGEAGPLAGPLELAWDDGRLEFSSLGLSAPGTLEHARLEGNLDFDRERLEADLAWRGLAWPPGTAAAAARVRSAEGSARLEGGLDQWQLTSDFALSGPDFPGGRLALRGEGGRDSARIEIPRGEVLGGQFAGSGSVNWSPSVEWSVQAGFRDLAIGALVDWLPGRISGELTARGAAEPTLLDVDIQGLSGTLRGRAVSAEGGLRFADGRPSARNLRVRSGQSEVQLHGDPRGPEGLRVEARVASLADFLDDASGRLDGRGRLRLTAGEPDIELEWVGEGIAWDSLALGHISVSRPAVAGGALEIVARDFGWSDFRAPSVRVSGSGARLLEHIELAADLPDGRVEARLAEGAVDWSAPLAEGWRGRLEHLRLDAGATLGFLELEAPAALRLGAVAQAVEDACLRGPNEGRMCVRSYWRAGGERSLEATLENLSPNLALSLLGSDLVFSQRLSGTVGWRRSPSMQPEARVDMVVSAGQMMFAGEDEPVLETGAGSFGFEISDGRLFGGNLDIPLPGTGGIDTDFSVPDLSEGLDSAMTGRLRLDLNSIEPLLQLTPWLEGRSGPVTADMRFSGSIADPRFTGHVSLVRGQLSLFATGLELEDLQLAGAVYEFNQTELNGTFRAGEGRGTIRAVVNFADMLAPELLLELRGETMTLVDVPDLNVVVDPDIRLTWREGALNVAGRVKVPSALLSPRYLPTASAVESRDVVIVGGVDPYERPEARENPTVAVRGELELELGKDVVLRLDRAQARLRGKSVFRWSGSPMPIAEGGFGLSGEIYAYGQLLKIRDGRVNFSKRPANNPFLNIRAERDIYGNSQVRHAGVLVTGTLERPIVEPYSVPMTTRERALALLVTGSDFDYEQGVGGVQVGMYVAPKLYVSYGVGLFDDQNVISARYDLGKGFSVRTTSGQRETGADISYTIEH